VDLVLITGYSGAGKSTAMQFFEDAGYFCVDNIPPEMLRSLADLFMHEGSKVEAAAVVCDARGGEYFESLVEVADELRQAGVSLRVLFLEADEQTLITRYRETRRRHPLATTGSVAEGIAAERALVAPLRDSADFVLDTTGLRPNHLRHRLADEVLTRHTSSPLAVRFTSFGHKHGPLRDADLILDVRFLPNPHYEARLRPLTGLDDRIIAYVNRDGALDAFLERLFPLLDYLLPQYVHEGKTHLVVGIGCTGGRHRSVVIAETLARRYRDADGYLVEVAHRDIDRDPGRLPASG
jgi:RNase adapter protein RapZ